MGEAHRLGMSTTATMVYGHIETLEERIDHLLALRALQDRRPAGTPGFRAFICWPMQLKGTELERLAQAGKLPDGISLPGEPSRWSPDEEFLRTVAIARLVLDNVDHIQASWLTTGLENGTRALHAGADDMGSIMIEENVVSAAGARHLKEGDARSGPGMTSVLCEAIVSAGFTPWLRDQCYQAR